MALHKNAERKYGNPDFKVENAYEPSFEGCILTKIIIVNSLQTMKHPLEAIKEEYRILRTGNSLKTKANLFIQTFIFTQVSSTNILEIPSKLATVVLAIGRISGWVAHCLEQYYR